MKRSAAFFPYSYSYSDSERRCQNPGTEKVQEISRDAGIMVGHCHHKFHCLAVCNGLCIWSAETLDGQKLWCLMGCLPRVPWSTDNLHASQDRSTSTESYKTQYLEMAGWCVPYTSNPHPPPVVNLQLQTQKLFLSWNVILIFLNVLSSCLGEKITELISRICKIWSSLQHVPYSTVKPLFFISALSLALINSILHHVYIKIPSKLQFSRFSMDFLLAFPLKVSTASHIKLGSQTVEHPSWTLGRFCHSGWRVEGSTTCANTAEKCGGWMRMADGA